ncbi:MAG: hypothetical protein ALECFALPRED_008645 [Alectoria fallacina]|uniref:Alcohol dehydrogenase-like N-terminal domain-containing protein n=1 Tax=Alectoria fallacina TaxID=1903189 RepID=A0A8H3ETF1_9LECA|nr:MAG: hypothetical protein ALECFALPRED_008645 [Alectoria fallacina]
MSTQAGVLKQDRANLTIEERPNPKPGPSDVVVKNHSFATNPVDWKMQEFGYFLEKYPAILGNDVSGVVNAVGSDVKHFKKDDRVTGFADGLLSKDPQNGAFQEYSVRTQFSPQRHSQKARRSSDVRLYNSSIVKDVTQTLKASNQQAVAAYDAIAENGSAPKCAEILEAFGWGKLCLTLSYPEDARIPAGVENSQTFAARICIGKEFGHRLFNEWLGKSLEDKTFVPSPAIEKLMAGSSPCRLEWKEASHHAVSSCSAMVHDIDE